MKSLGILKKFTETMNTLKPIRFLYKVIKIDSGGYLSSYKDVRSK